MYFTVENLFSKLLISHGKHINKYGAALLRRTISDFPREMFALLLCYI